MLQRRNEPPLDQILATGHGVDKCRCWSLGSMSSKSDASDRWEAMRGSLRPLPTLAYLRSPVHLLIRTGSIRAWLALCALKLSPVPDTSFRILVSVSMTFASLALRNPASRLLQHSSGFEIPSLNRRKLHLPRAEAPGS